MKCRVCSTEIPEGKKCCPNCGRVVTATESKPSQNPTGNYTSVSDRTMVYRPASSSSAQAEEKTISITDIFSSDPNAPVYTDPHTYDRATADVLAYDKMFMSKSKVEEDVKVFTPQPAPEKNVTDFTIEPEYDDSDDDFDEQEEVPAKGTVIRDRKIAKPRFNFNIKYLILAVAVITGLVVIVSGMIQLGRQFGIFDSVQEEPGSGISAEKDDNEDEPPKKNDDSPEVDNSYTAKTGVYTVYSDQNHIFVYKSVTDQRIIATIPNKTILEISEIDNDYGKTTYNSYTGWVKLSELKFTPNEVPEKETETQTEATSEPSSDEVIPDYQPGTYTVTLNGTNTTLNVRSTGSTEGEIVTTLTEGTQVTVEEVKSSWGKIFVGDVEGWVYMEYLK